MRRLFLAFAGVFLAAVIALLIALRSQSFVLGAAHWAVKAFSGLRLELVDPRIDLYSANFSASEIHLMPQGSEGPALFSVLNFAASLPDSAQASSILVYISESEEAANPKPMQWLGYLRWLPSELRIGQVHLVTASANTWIFPLKQLRGDRIDTGDYRLAAEADYEGEPLEVVVDLLSVGKGWGTTAAEANIRLTAPASGSEFTLAGTLEGTEDDFQYHFELAALYRDISEFLKGFEGGTTLAGELHLRGSMAGDTGGFVLSDATFLLDNMPAYGFEAGGTLEYQFTGESRINLVGTGELDSLSYLLDWIDVDLSDFGRAQSSLRLSGSLDRPVIEDFRLATSTDAGLAISMNGTLNLYKAEEDEGALTNAIFIDLQGPSLGVLSQWLGDLPYEPGPWRASGELTGNQARLALKNIVVESGTPESLQIRATGAIGSIAALEESQGDYFVSDLALSLTAFAPDSAAIGSLLRRDDIPPHHEVTANVNLSGTGDELQFSEGRVSVTASDLDVSIGPIAAVLQPSVVPALSELGGPVLIELSDTAALSQYVSQSMPVLGPLRIQAQLAQQGELFQLLDLNASVSDGELNIQARGRVGDLLHFSDISLSSSISGLNSGVLLATLLPDFSYAEPLGTLEGSFVLSDNDGAWNISKLMLEAGNDKTPMSFSVDGEINDLAGLVTANLNSRFNARDPALVEALTGIALPPAKGSLVVKTTPGQIQGSIKGQLGETLLDGNGDITLVDTAIAGVRLSLSTPHLHLQDLGFAPAQDAAVAEQNPETKDSGTLLAKLRSNSPPFPVNVSVNIDGISGEYSYIDSLRVRLSGSDNRYTLEQFSAHYNEALAEFRGIIDLNPELPALSVAGEATALPLSAILKDVGVTTDISGALTIRGGVTVMGDTPELLISNLNGSVAFALENAVIEGAAYDLLATDLLAWIYSGALTDKSTYLDCAMAKFQLRQGVASTQSLYVESAKMIATGSAEFDLVKQRMDVRITPLSKSRLLQVPSEVRLKGDMSDPKADISPISAVADAATSALMLIPNLTLALFGINQSSGEAYRPCQADLSN